MNQSNSLVKKVSLQMRGMKAGLRISPSSKALLFSIRQLQQPARLWVQGPADVI